LLRYQGIHELDNTRYQGFVVSGTKPKPFLFFHTVPTVPSLENEDRPFLMIAWSAGASSNTGNGNRLFLAPASWLSTNRRPKRDQLRRPSSGILLLTSDSCLWPVSVQDGGYLGIAQ
jgi:hypothetical protein